MSKQGVKSRIFVKVDESKLIGEIRKRRVLYDTNMKEYKRHNFRQAAWNEVARVMGLSEAEVKKRWRSLRDAYIKHIRQTTESQRGNMLHYDLLTFLYPYVSGDNARRRVTIPGTKTEMITSDNGQYIIEFQKQTDESSIEGNVKFIPYANEDEIDGILEDHLDKSLEHVHQNPGSPETTTTTTYAIDSSGVVESQAEPTGIMKVDYDPLEQQQHAGHDSEEKFLLSCAPSLKRLPQRKNVLARVKIQELLFEMEFGTKYNE